MTTQRSLGLIALLALLLPEVAGGSDLTFSFGGYTDYDSNVFRRDENAPNANVEDDVLFRLIPGVKLHEDRGQDLNYSFEYRVPMEFSVNFGDELNDVDQWFDADVFYHASDRLDLYVRNNFRYLRSTLQTTQTLDSQQEPIVSTGRDRVTLNELVAGGSYRFTPRLNGNLSLNYRIFDTTNPNRADNFTINASGDVGYTLTSKQRVSAGLQYFHQDFDETINRVGSQSDTVNLFAGWRYQLGETLGIDIAAGPSYIVVDQDDAQARSVRQIPFIDQGTFIQVGNFATCPTEPIGTEYFGNPADPNTRATAICPPDIVIPKQIGGVDNPLYLDIVGRPLIPLSSASVGSTRSSSVDFFANASITKRWAPNFITLVRYSRTQGVASGLGGTVIRDTVTASADWNFRDRWNLLLRGDWTLRNSVTEANGIFRLAVADGTFPTLAAVEGSQVSGPLPTNSIRTERWGAVGRLTHQLFRKTDVILQLTYNNQTSDQGTLGTGSDFQGYIATLGVRHVFEPIKLW